MKLKTIILGLLALLCLLFTGFHTYKLQQEHAKHVAEWNEGAKAAFEEALRMEVYKRLKEAKIIKGNAVKEEKIDSIVTITLGNEKTYHIENTKYKNSLIKESGNKMLVGGLLAQRPLAIDTLAMHWDSCLLVKQITANSQIRYIYTDEDLNNDTVYSRINNPKHLDSLTIKYLGTRCEHEFTAFISCPYSLSDMLKGLVCMGGLPWFFFALLAWQYSKLERWICHKFVREQVKVVVQEKIVEVEKEIYVQDMPIEKAEVFKLPDGTLFHSSTKCLSRGGIKHSIQPQTVSLLKLFMSNSEYKVTDAEICWALWQEDREKNRLYTAIQRLRNDLKAVHSNLSINRSGESYELK